MEINESWDTQTQAQGSRDLKRKIIANQPTLALATQPIRTGLIQNIACGDWRKE
jgi:hypothetical protein